MKITKVLFVRPSLYADTGKLVTANSFFDRITGNNVAELSLPLLAAYTPSHIDVAMCDDCLNEIDFKTEAEVIVISAQIIHIDRVIDIIKEFKSLGKVVLVGGYLPTMHPEALEGVADSVCIGEGDEIWPQMIKDIESDCLKPVYRADFKMSLDQMPIPRYDLIKCNRVFPHVTSMPVQATRGCPYRCDYCSIVCFYQNTYRHRPIDDIIRDIKAHGKKQMHFVDDNLMEDKKFAKNLFRRMAGMNLMWGVQGTVNMAEDRELLDLAYKAGCRIVMLGFETFSQENLRAVDKSWATVDKYGDAVSKIQSAGIAVHALIVLGLPGDTKETFGDTVDILESFGVAAAEFFIFTPYPKTKIGKKYLEEGRIIDFNLSHYREPYVVFDHPNLSGAELKAGYWQALEQFYSLRSIFKRLFRGSFKGRLIQLALNLHYWLKIKRKIVPTHFQRSNYLLNESADSPPSEASKRAFEAC